MIKCMWKGLLEVTNPQKTTSRFIVLVFPATTLRFWFTAPLSVVLAFFNKTVQQHSWLRVWAVQLIRLTSARAQYTGTTHGFWLRMHFSCFLPKREGQGSQQKRGKAKQEVRWKEKDSPNRKSTEKRRKSKQEVKRKERDSLTRKSGEKKRTAQRGSQEKRVGQARQEVRSANSSSQNEASD